METAVRNVMAKMEQLHFWNDAKTPYPRGDIEAAHSSDSNVAPNAPPDEFNTLALPELKESEPARSGTVEDGPPTARPLQAAIDAGVFGLTIDGPITLDNEGVAALTAEHANEMIILLADSHVMEEALRLEHDPATERVPKTEEEKRNLLARIDKEWKRLTQSYADAVAAYAEGFGDAAAEKLDQWVRRTVADGAQKQDSYPPSHPWHYFHAGDNAKPMPVDSILPNPEAGKWLAERLPKNPAKRAQKLRDMLDHEQSALAADKARYADIVERGAEALSQYDRTIAHTSDAMAVATALALKYNHVSGGLSRVAWLKDELQQTAPDFFSLANGEDSALRPGEQSCSHDSRREKTPAER